MGGADRGRPWEKSVTDQSEHHRHPIGDPLGQEADALIDPEAPVEVPPADQMSLVRRLRQPRTILSIAVPLAIIVIAVALNWTQMRDVPGDISRANPWLILLAFSIYYLGFPLRGWRWTKLLKGAGYKVKVKDGTEILFLSWLVNCIVPAKMGEYMELRKPVIATRLPGLEAEFGALPGVLYVERPEEVLDRVDELLSDARGGREAARRLGETCRGFVTARGDWDSVTARFRAILLGTLNGRS